MKAGDRQGSHTEDQAINRIHSASSPPISSHGDGVRQRRCQQHAERWERGTQCRSHGLLLLPPSLLALLPAAYCCEEGPHGAEWEQQSQVSRGHSSILNTAALTAPLRPRAAGTLTFPSLLLCLLPHEGQFYNAP